jgi:hypothetical protein
MLNFQVRWRNFRSFEDSDWVDISPITVLIGPNNSGKSSFLAPLLLLKQTLQSRHPTLALLTRGDLSNVGSYADVVFDHEEDRDLVFALRWHWHEPSGTDRPVGAYPPGEVRLSFAFDPEVGDIVLSKFEVFDVLQRKYLTRKRRKDSRYSLAEFPEKPTSRSRDRSSVARGEAAVRRERPIHFLFSARDVLYPGFEDLPGDEPEERPRRGAVTRFEPSQFTRLYLSVATTTSAEVGELLRTISYLGPLREPIRRGYEVSGDPPGDVGTRGQFAPELLYRRPELLSETSEWLRRFDFGRRLATEVVREDAFSVIVKAGGRRPSMNLADVGFGVSQVLPLVVQGLAAAPRSTIIAEQPEIHLNPRLQSTVADFMGYLAESGRGILAETHSEHLLLRLRTLIAKGMVSQEDVRLYFVEKIGTRSSLRAIPVTADGHIASDEWPSGFFQESVRQALALATEQDRRRRRAQRRGD